MPSYCIICGTQLPEVSRFCRKCGAAQYPDDLPVAEVPVVRVPPPSVVEEPVAAALLHSEIHSPSELPEQAPNPGRAENVELGHDSQEVPEAEFAAGSQIATSADTGEAAGLVDLPEREPGDMTARLLAYLADLSVVYLLVFSVAAAAGVIGAIVGRSSEVVAAVKTDVTPLFLVCLVAYMSLAQAFYHTTVGKYIFRLEVISARPDRLYPHFGRILVRESVGRFVSCFFWGAGCWTAPRRPFKQAWSDQIAGTRVTTRSSTHTLLRRAFIGFVLIAAVVDVAAMAYGEYNEEHEKRQTSILNQLQAESAATNMARKEVVRLTNETTPTPSALRDNMEALIRQLDVYEGHLDKNTALLNTVVDEKLYSSSRDRSQCVSLQHVYALRRKQAEILRSQSNMILQMPEMSGHDRAIARTKLADMDSDITAIDHQVDKAMKDAGFE